MIIVLDSSVLVSAIKFRGLPLELVQMGFEGKVDIAISQSIIDETLRVLRLKFNAIEAELDAAGKIMHSCGRMVQVQQYLNAVPADPKDNHIVECAVAAKADAIISGDHHLLDLKQYSGIKMMTVRVSSSCRDDWPPYQCVLEFPEDQDCSFFASVADFVVGADAARAAGLAGAAGGQFQGSAY